MMQRAALGTGIASAHCAVDSINSASDFHVRSGDEQGGVEADFFNFNLERLSKLKASNIRRGTTAPSPTNTSSGPSKKLA